MRLVLLGAPGSGKGTQGPVLAEHFGVPYIASGELLRAQAAAGTDVGRKATAYLDRGDLVPDEVVAGVIGEALRAATESGGYVLDGHPRTLGQAQRLEELAGSAPDAAVYLELPDDVARTRLAGRASAGRTDDASRAATEQRLRLFHSETEPLLDFYRTRGILTAVDATRSPGDITAAIVDAMSGSGSR